MDDPKNHPSASSPPPSHPTSSPPSSSQPSSKNPYPPLQFTYTQPVVLAGAPYTPPMVPSIAVKQSDWRFSRLCYHGKCKVIATRPSGSNLPNYWCPALYDLITVPFATSTAANYDQNLFDGPVDIDWRVFPPVRWDASGGGAGYIPLIIMSQDNWVRNGVVAQGFCNLVVIPSQGNDLIIHPSYFTLTCQALSEWIEDYQWHDPTPFAPRNLAEKPGTNASRSSNVSGTHDGIAATPAKPNASSAQAKTSTRSKPGTSASPSSNVFGSSGQNAAPVDSFGSSSNPKADMKLQDGVAGTILARDQKRSQLRAEIAKVSVGISPCKNMEEMLGYMGRNFLENAELVGGFTPSKDGGSLVIQELDELARHLVSLQYTYGGMFLNKQDSDKLDIVMSNLSTCKRISDEVTNLTLMMGSTAFEDQPQPASDISGKEPVTTEEDSEEEHSSEWEHI